DDVFPTPRDWPSLDAEWWHDRWQCRATPTIGIALRGFPRSLLTRAAIQFPLPGRFIVGAGAVSPLFTSIFTSTRRFSARPERVLLSATGSSSPKPYGVTIRRSGILCCSTR